MAGRRAAEAVIVLLVVVVVGPLLVGQVLGQPVLLSYVETGSMRPTLQPGDGFIAVPASLAGPIEKGDVVVFRAKHLHGGGLTTHRVVGRTEQGFITKGDANPFTDQSGGEPPVSRAQIVAEALQVGGNVVVIPNLGVVVTATADATGAIAGAVSGGQRQLARLLGSRAVLGTDAIAYLLFGIGVLFYLFSVTTGSGARRRGRDGSRKAGFNATLAVVGIVGIVVLALTLTAVLPSGTHSFRMVSAADDAPGPSVIERGSNETTGYRIQNGGVLPVVVFLSPGGEGISVSPRELRVPGGRSANATVTLQAPPETGYYPRYLVEHWYPAILPVSLIRWLHAIHPWLPIAVIDVLVAVGTGGIATAVVGTGRIRLRSREVSLSTRIKQWFR